MKKHIAQCHCAIKMPRICVIGAGPSGMSVAHHVARIRKEKPDCSIEMVIYERQADWGGLWNFNWRNGLDENGEPVHASMYRHLWSNGPKEASLEFPDYTFDDHFGKSISSFPPREVLRDYLEGRFRRCNSRDKIRFNHIVRSVTFDSNSNTFTVLAKNITTDNVLPAETFDFVLNCTGHFSVPNVPEFPGIASFPGRVMHSHDFRHAEEFKDKNIVVVGSSYSAEDLAMQTIKYGAKSVTISYRTNPMGFKWPSGIVERPLITSINGRVVTFADGSSVEADSIIMCTGYLHHYPYLSDQLRLNGPNELYPRNLYKGTVWTLGGNGRMLYIGIQDQYYTFTMFDAQARWAVKFIVGDVAMPTDVDAVAKDIAVWRQRQSQLKDCHDEIDFQSAFTQDLANDSDYGADLDIGDLFHDWERNKYADIVSYRDKQHRSKYTGNMSVMHHTKWLNAMDDSMQAFLSN